MTIDESRIESPVGEVFWAARDGAVIALGFDVQIASLRARIAARHPGEAWRVVDDAGDARSALEAYFAGDHGAISRLSVAPEGTPFQRRVWSALRDIPVGATSSYAALAAAVGAPQASRAVGAANARNPVSLLVPCHRVIGATGDLRGYAGGVERKRWLLAHEGCSPRR